MLGYNLQLARRWSGMTQEQVMLAIWPSKTRAIDGKVRKNRISEIESGMVAPGAPILYRLCSLYGVSVDFVMGISAEPEVDATAGRVGMLYHGLQACIETAVESLCQQASNHILSMPKPYTMALLDAAKQVWRIYAASADRLSEQTPLNQAMSDMMQQARQYEREMALQMRRLETSMAEIREPVVQQKKMSGKLGKSVGLSQKVSTPEPIHHFNDCAQFDWVDMTSDTDNDLDALV